MPVDHELPARLELDGQDAAAQLDIGLVAERLLEALGEPLQRRAGQGLEGALVHRLLHPVR